MKRRTSFSFATATIQNFPSVIIFKSGVEELLDILQQEKPTVLKIEDMEYEYESLDELFTKYQGKEVKFLKIFAFYSENYLNTVMLTIKRSRINFYSTETTPKTLALLLRLKQFFKRHERQSTAYFFNPFLYFLMVAALILVIATTIPSTLAQRFTVGLFMLIIASSFFYRNRVGGFSRIFVIDRHEQESFFSRNKDTIWVGVIVGIVTAFVTWVVTYLTTR